MEIAIITLSIIVLGQLVERHFYSLDMNQRVSDAMKAVMSRNINEFIAATTKPRDGVESKSESEEVNLSEATDDEFVKHIQQVNK